MSQKSVIKHKGYVKKVSDNSLLVTILNRSACADCHAKGVCGIADKKEKEIEISGNGFSYSPGQVVTVVFRESTGFRALLYGYLLPLLAVILTLIILIFITDSEIISGLAAIGILIPYYITLYFLRHYFKKVFKFELHSSK